MRFWCLGLCLLGMTAVPARAHHIWIIPSPKGDTAMVTWCDTPEPDNVEEKLTTIAKARVFMRRANGRVEDLKWTEDKDVYRLDCPGEDVRTVAATWEGNGCLYFAKAYLPDKAGKFEAPEPGKAWERLELEIVPRPDRAADAYQVLFKGRPLAGVLVVTHAAGMYLKLPRPRTDKDGLFTFTAPKPGVYGFRVQYKSKEAKAPEGKQPVDQFYASTLVIRVPEK
jgi:uncharacterized GH25 family protein